MPLRTGSSSLTSVEPNAPLQYASQTASQAEVISISYSVHRSGVPGVRIENSKPFAAVFCRVSRVPSKIFLNDPST
jgi:hypothetical protein